MKSRASCFNLTVLKKDFTRFLPVWGLYMIFLLLMATIHLSREDVVFKATMLGEGLLQGMAVVNLIYAGICAMTLLGDLYVTRMCNALHAMPLRREGWLLTHGAAGLLFSLLPNLAAALVAVPMLKQHWYMAFIWLGGAELQFLFFFGAALFAGLCAGNRLGMAAVYVILNFFSMFMLGMINLFYAPLLYGVVVPPEPFMIACPVANMMGQEYLYFNYTAAVEAGTMPLVGAAVRGGWIYLGITAGIGLVLFGLAILLYRRRQLERAGDLLAVRFLEPVFLVIMTLACGMLLRLLVELFLGEQFHRTFLLVGLAVGYFGGRMLLSRKVAVFRPRTIVGGVLLAAALFGSMALTSWDPLGISLAVPETARVENAVIIADQWGAAEPVDSPEEIDQIRQIHDLLAREGISGEVGGPASEIRIVYQTKLGGTITRKYLVHTTSSALEPLRSFLSDSRRVLGMEDPELARQTFTSGVADLWEEDKWQMGIPKEHFDLLLDALLADCREGRMAQLAVLHAQQPDEAEGGTVQIFSDADRVGTLELNFRDRQLNQHTLRLKIYSDSEHTLQALRQIFPPAGPTE